MKRELKKSVVYSLYGISFLLLLSAVLIPLFSTKNTSKQQFDYVSKGILDYESNVKVVNTETEVTIGKPFNDEKVKIVKKFYDYKETNENQEKSLIYYEGTYMQSSGISYSNEDGFDVIAILDGVVESIKEDNILGNVLTIRHDNGITSVYQSISDIVVKEGTKINKGDMLAKSSTSNISTDLGNHLYFELIVNGLCVNPEDYYGKNLDEI